MIIRFRIVALLFLFAFVLLSIATGQEKKSALANNEWMTGCWQMGDNPDSIEEWMRPVGNMMIGMARTVKDNKTVTFEFMQIKLQPDGEVYFIPKLPGKNEEFFKLIKSSPTESIFEDLKHPWPQRIIYRHPGDDDLAARIEGTDNGKEKSVDFYAKRVRCQ